MRCRWAIKFGVLHTRCTESEAYHITHAGNGLEQFGYQTITWFPGDPREYETDRSDEFAWEEP